MPKQLKACQCWLIQLSAYAVNTLNSKLVADAMMELLPFADQAPKPVFQAGFIFLLIMLAAALPLAKILVLAGHRAALLYEISSFSDCFTLSNC